MEDFNNKKDLLLKQKEEDDKNKQLQVILSNKLKHFNGQLIKFSKLLYPSILFRINSMLKRI